MVTVTALAAPTAVLALAAAALSPQTPEHRPLAGSEVAWGPEAAAPAHAGRTAPAAHLAPSAPAVASGTFGTGGVTDTDDTAGHAPSDRGVSATPARLRTQWVWPLSPTPRVVRVFVRPRTTWGAGHRGVDLAATAGQPVRAAAAGTVAHVGMVAGRPTLTVLHPSGIRTTYEPVHARVPEGRLVAAGDVIGSVAGPGSHCGDDVCLHLGALRGRSYLDPLVLVNGGPVVLLPLR